jgi:hypothetical protein
MKKSILAVVAVAFATVIVFSSLTNELQARSAKDGIKSTATGNCWGDGSDCKKEAEETF